MAVERVRHPGGLAEPAVLGVIAVGGVLGAWSRYGIGRWLPHDPDAWPASTLLVNISGCLLLGMLTVLVVELSAPHRLVRPFLGVGVLGGFTTFSTAGIEVRQLLDAGRPAPALGYLAASAGSAVIAVWLGMTAVRVHHARRQRRLRHPTRSTRTIERSEDVRLAGASRRDRPR